MKLGRRELLAAGAVGALAQTVGNAGAIAAERPPLGSAARTPCYLFCSAERCLSDWQRVVHERTKVNHWKKIPPARGIANTVG